MRRRLSRFADSAEVTIRVVGTESVEFGGSVYTVRQAANDLGIPSMPTADRSGVLVQQHNAEQMITHLTAVTGKSVQAIL